MNNFEPSFVLVNHITRSIMYINDSPPKATFEDAPYSSGEVGILHPYLVRRFNDIFPSEGVDGFLRSMTSNTFNRFFTRPQYQSSTSGPELYWHTKGELPIVLYDCSTEREKISLGIPGEKPIIRNIGYFIAPLLGIEFTLLPGTTDKELIRNARQIAEDKDARKLIDGELEESIRYLRVFDKLMSDSYEQLPIEVTKRRRTEEEAKTILELYST